MFLFPCPLLAVLPAPDLAVLSVYPHNRDIFDDIITAFLQQSATCTVSGPCYYSYTLLKEAGVLKNAYSWQSARLVLIQYKPFDLRSSSKLVACHA